MTRHIFAEDFTLALSDELLAWCLSHGGSEFTVDLLGEQGRPAPLVDALTAALLPSAVAAQPRPLLTYPVGAKDRPVPLWRFNRETLSLLAPLLPDGLFTYDTDMANGWLEDLTIFRGETMLLGVVSHEREGRLEVSAAEADELNRLGIPTRDSGVWV